MRPFIKKVSLIAMIMALVSMLGCITNYTTEPPFESGYIDLYGTHENDEVEGEGGGCGCNK